MNLRILAALLLLFPIVTQADAAAGKRKAEVCAACHGADGNSPSGLIPILAGQTARYLYLQLRDFGAGRRKDPSMEPVAAALGREDMLDLAEYFSTQKVRPTGFVADPAKAARGRAKAQEALCTMCHLGGLLGQNEIPRLAGQHPQYTVKQLKDFKARTRTNDAGNMTSLAQTLTDEDIENLAEFIANLY